MPLSFLDKEVHLYLGDGEHSTKEGIKSYLREVFAALAQKTDLEEFTINFFSEEAERAFFECCKTGACCEVSSWCSVIRQNPNLSQCYIHRCYRPVSGKKLRIFPHYTYSHYWQNKADYSKNQDPKKKAVYEEFKKHLKDPNFTIKLELDWDSGEEFEWLPKFPMIKLIAPREDHYSGMECLFQTEEETNEIDRAVFREAALNFSYFFNQDERNALLSRCIEDIDEAIAQKAFVFFQNEYKAWQSGQTRYKKVDKDWMTFNRCSTTLLLRLFEISAQCQSPIFTDLRYLGEDCLTSRVFSAIEKQLRADKRCPIRDIQVNHPTREALSFFLSRLPSIISGQAEFNVEIMTIHFCPFGFNSNSALVHLTSILEEKLEKPSSIVYNIKLIVPFSDGVLDHLIQIQSLNAKIRRKQAIAEHQKKKEHLIEPAQLSLDSGESRKSVMVKHGTEIRVKTALPKERLRIQQQVQASVSMQKSQQQMTLTRVQKQIQAQTESQHQQALQHNTPPPPVGELWSREQVWVDRALWDAVTAYVKWDDGIGNTHVKDHPTYLTYLSKEAWKAILENEKQFLGGIEWSLLPDGFYVQDHPIDGKKVLAYSPRFQLSSSDAKTQGFKWVPLSKPKAPLLPDDLLFVNENMKKIFALSVGIEQKGRTWAAGNTSCVYNIIKSMQQHAQRWMAMGEAKQNELINLLTHPPIVSYGIPKYWSDIFHAFNCKLSEGGPLNGPSGFKDAINKDLEDSQKKLTSEFSVAEWLGLETIYFRLGTYGVKDFLNGLRELNTKQLQLYKHFRETFLAAAAMTFDREEQYKGDWSSFLTGDFEKKIRRLSMLPPGALSLWQGLVDAHYKKAGELDFTEMYRAFEHFLNQLKELEGRHQLAEGTLERSIPQLCEFTDAHNFFTSISRLYSMLNNSLDPEEQIKNISGLSLSAVGAVHASRQEQFNIVRASMALSPENSPKSKQFFYAASNDSVVTAIRDSKVTQAELMVLLHRVLGKEKIHAGFDAYERVQNRLAHAEQLTAQEQKLAFALCVWTSMGEDNFNGLATENNGLNALITHLEQARIQSKKQTNNKLLNLLTPLPFSVAPNLMALNKWLSCCSLSQATVGELEQAIQQMKVFLATYGSLAWGQLMRDDVTSLTDLQNKLSELTWDQSAGFLSTLDEQLKKFDLDEQQVLRKLITFISSSEDINREGPRLLKAALDYKSTHQLHDFLNVQLEMVRKRALSLTQSIALMEGLSPRQISLTVVSALSLSSFNLCKQNDNIINEIVVPGLETISKELSGHAKQVAAVRCLQHLLQAPSSLTSQQKSELLNYFIFLIQKGLLQPNHVLKMIEQLSPKTLEKLFDWPKDDSLIFLLNTSMAPALLTLATQYPKKDADIFISILMKQVKLPEIELAQVLLEKIKALTDDIKNNIKTLYQNPPYPPISSLLTFLNQDPVNLSSLDREPYGQRDLKKQLDNAQVYRVLSNYDSMLMDDRFDNLKRKEMKRRLDALQDLASPIAQMSTETLQQEIQKVVISDGPNREQEILMLLAQLRELAYRTVPGSRETGLFAQTTQLTAVLDAVFHGRNLGLQVATGEGKSLISALICSCNTLIYKKPIDLVTSNPTLAGRDQEQFQLFYRTCGIPTSLISARSELGEYIQKGPGINVSDVGGMNLFQLRHDFECNLGEIENMLLLDEGDDTLLDNKTTFNHPVNLKGDSALASSPILWIYPLLMEYVHTTEFFDSKSRGEDVNKAIRYLQKRQNVTFESLVELKDEIDEWLDSAVTAKELVRLTQSPQEKQDRYSVIDEKREVDGEEIVVKYARIVTDGRVDYQAQWGNGVHQLLHAELNNQRVKEGKTPQFLIDPEQDIVLSMSAKNFLRRYKKNRIISLTATSGSYAERYECRQKYGMDFHEVPPHNSLNRVELPTWYAEDERRFDQLIIEQIRMCQREKKPLVIVCETPKEVMRLHHAIQHSKQLVGVTLQTLTGSNPEQEKDVVAKAGNVGMVTISTAMISRGTDIQLEDPTKSFRVLQTYLSKERVNIQIKGRTSRQGQKGEYGVLVNVQHYPDELTKKRIKKRYLIKDTVLRKQLWGGRELNDTIARQQIESVADIKNILNQMYLGLKRYCKQHHISMGDHPDILWHRLLKNFDDKVAELNKTGKTLPQLIGDLVDDCAENWEDFWKKQPEAMIKTLQEDQPFTRPHFYQQYAMYVEEEDRYWFEIPKDQKPMTPIVLKETQNEAGVMQVDLKEMRQQLIDSIHEWNTEVKRRMQTALESLGKKHEDVPIPAHASKQLSIREEKVMEAVKDAYVCAQYDPNLDGHAKIYSCCFAEEKAFFRRPLFANVRAWYHGHGTLFADTRASWWYGTRPKFANLRMSLKLRALKKAEKKLEELIAKVDEDQKLICNDILEKYKKLHFTFFDNQELETLKTQVEEISSKLPERKNNTYISIIPSRSSQQPHPRSAIVPNVLNGFCPKDRFDGDRLLQTNR